MQLSQLSLAWLAGAQVVFVGVVARGWSILRGLHVVPACTLIKMLRTELYTLTVSKS